MVLDLQICFVCFTGIAISSQKTGGSAAQDPSSPSSSPSSPWQQHYRQDYSITYNQPIWYVCNILIQLALIDVYQGWRIFHESSMNLSIISPWNPEKPTIFDDGLWSLVQATPWQLPSSVPRATAHCYRAFQFLSTTGHRTVGSRGTDIRWMGQRNPKHQLKTVVNIPLYIGF